MAVSVTRVRGPEQVAAATELVWEFFCFLRERYPEMASEIDDYIAHQDVAGQLRNFEEFFRPPNGECFLAIREGKPVGTVMLRPRGDAEGEMNRMYVRASARGLGLGRALGAACIEEACALGYRRLFLDALYRHEEALPLYESLGFVRYDDPDAFGGADERIVHMRMDLPAV